MEQIQQIRNELLSEIEANEDPSSVLKSPKIKELYNVQKLKDIIKDYGIIPGQTISRDEILDKLIKAYSDNNITYIKPKATILKDWFFIEELTINKNKFYHIIDFK